MRKILFLAVPMFVFTPALAEWVKVDTGVKQGEAHYFDPETVQKDGHYRKVWILSSYQQMQSGGYRSVKSLYEFDCREEKARSYTMLLYPDTKAVASIIGAQHDKSKDWFDYSANSALGHIADVVCEQ